MDSEEKRNLAVRRDSAGGNRPTPVLMRKLVLAFTILPAYLAVSPGALACRGPIHTVAEIVRQSTSIFTATVVSSLPNSNTQDAVELRVIDVLKGSVPQTVSAKSGLIMHPNDHCLAIEAGTPQPKISIGEQWLISANFDAAGNVVPTSGGNFRLSKADGTSLEGSEKLLSEFKQQVLSETQRSGAGDRREPAVPGH